jgi:hypothetical protein
VSGGIIGYVAVQQVDRRYYGLTSEQPRYATHDVRAFQVSMDDVDLVPANIPVQPKHGAQIVCLFLVEYADWDSHLTQLYLDPGHRFRGRSQGDNVPIEAIAINGCGQGRLQYLGTRRPQLVDQL